MKKIHFSPSIQLLVFIDGNWNLLDIPVNEQVKYVVRTTETKFASTLHERSAHGENFENQFAGGKLIFVDIG